jgi:hypothetical protein
LLLPAFSTGKELNPRKSKAFVQPEINSLGKNRQKSSDTTQFCNEAKARAPPSHLFSFDKQESCRQKKFNNVH